MEPSAKEKFSNEFYSRIFEQRLGEKDTRKLEIERLSDIGIPYTIMFETETENETIIPCRAMAFVKHTFNDLGGKLSLKLNFLT